MPIIFGNARIGFPHRKSYSSKTKSEVWPFTLDHDKNRDEYHAIDASQTSVLLSIPGPEKHTWTIKQLNHEEQPDDMQMAPWKRPFARLIGLTSVINLTLTSYIAYYQLLAVLEMKKTQAYPVWRTFLAWFIVTCGFLLTSE